MSVASTMRDHMNNYQYGRLCALTKLGMDAGPAVYAEGQGAYGVGSYDARQDMPDRQYRNSNDIERAFATNANVDHTTTPEASATQPHGLKMGMSGIGRGVAAAGIKGPTSASLGKASSAMTMKPPMGIKPPTISKSVGNAQNKLVGTATGGGGVKPAAQHQNLAMSSSIGSTGKVGIPTVGTPSTSLVPPSSNTGM